MLNACRLTFALLSLFTALIFFIRHDESGTSAFLTPGTTFVRTRGVSFVVGDRPFRFVGANVAVVYGETERERMLETLQAVRASGVHVVRIWAHGEWNSTSEVGRAPNEWLRAGAFRDGRDGWNEAAFVHLDRTLAEAARLDLRVQLCLANWWRDTGGVAQYLAWAGRTGAADESAPFRINTAAAMEFYTDPEARRLYRSHIERILTRRNTVTGTLYRDDPAIFAYELMNEAQSLPGREGERRAWVDEMSRFAKSLDLNHLITPGVWGYRTARERREWLADHALPAIDFCDVHLYPRDDADSFVDTPIALGDFIENRMAAALHLRKPLIFGEFGMVPEGFAGVSQKEWFRAYFASASRAGVAGAFFWIATPDEEREYGVTLTAARDRGVQREIKEAAKLFAASAGSRLPRHLFNAGAYLVPHTANYVRSDTESGSTSLMQPRMSIETDDALLYRFAPESLARAQFEKLGGGEGYVWGAGVGFFEFIVPARARWRTVGEIVVRAHLQPVPPVNAPAEMNRTRVTLFVNGVDCGSRIVVLEKDRVTLQEWHVIDYQTRIAAALGRSLALRFSVAPDTNLPFGLNLSNFPVGYDAQDGRAPLEVEIK